MAKKKEEPKTEDRLSRIEQFLAAPVEVGGANARQPLGPPKDFYTEQSAYQGEMGTVDPEFAAKGPYITGDEWMPGYGMSDEDRDQLKARMFAAGLYGSGGYSSGSWTQADANAYQIVLESANGMGRRDPNVVIDNLASEARRGARVRAPRAPLVNQISNPDDIRAIVRKSAYELTGSRLSDEEEQRLISMYQGSQTAENQAVHAAGGAAEGATTTVIQAAGMQNFAEAQIERMRPGEVASHRHLDAFDKILQSMGTLATETPEFEGGGLPRTTGTEVL
jgi:hypothetical protein